jgi:hypothetical protein
MEGGVKRSLARRRSRWCRVRRRHTAGGGGRSSWLVCYTVARSMTRLVPSTAENDRSIRCKASLRRHGEMIRGGKNFKTSPFPPLVSIMTPRRNASETTLSATSPLANSNPLIKPLPRTTDGLKHRRLAVSVSHVSSTRELADMDEENALSRQWLSIALRPVTKAKLLPRKVPLCSPGRQTSSSGFKSTSEKGRPYPLSALDRHTMSGVMPLSSKEKNVPVRPQPAWMSSTIRRLSCRLARSARRRNQLGVAVWIPPSPWMVSTRNAAGAS